jgi:putative aldouronate transport system permease protein
MKTTKDVCVFNILGYTLIGLWCLVCIFPIILLISGSLSVESDISQFGFSIIPRHFTGAAYNLIFKAPGELMQAYGVTIFITVVGAGLGLIITAMTAYVISRKDFRYRNPITFFFYFTTLFNGGLLSTYIFVIRYLRLKNSLLALILPLLINVFYLLIMRSFVSSVPESIVESGKIEGCSDYTIFFRLVLPLLKPALATIGLFLALDYWNDWYNAMLYITDHKLYPLQYMLYNLLSATDAMSRVATNTGIPMGSLPSQSLKMAMAVVATGPIILIYPWVQKYFIKGITVGSVKG